MASIKNTAMPVLENVQVSLNEILEVRGECLEEWELWGVLFQTTEAVQDIFLRGHACGDGTPQYLVTPNNLVCTSRGRILLNVCHPENITGTKYWCPEMTIKDFYSNSCNLEKIYVFTIGQTILHAAYYDAHKKCEKNFSPLFKTVLQAMCQNDVDLRMVLTDISEVCCSHAYKHMKGYTFLKSVISLHREVLGSLPENEILLQVDQDVMQENETEEVECESDDPFESVNYDAKHYSYGHRLGYHPVLSNLGKSSKNTHKISPKERWKKAYCKIVDELRKSKRPLLNKEKVIEEWKKHKAHQTIFRVYEELTERRKMLELLRLSINIGPSAPVDVDKNPLLMTGLKPKTMAELVMLLQRPPKQPVITSTSSSDVPSCSLENLNLPSNLSQSLDEGSFDHPLYALHKVTSKVPLKLSIINSLPGPQFIIGQLKPHLRISLLSNDSLEYQSSILNISIILLTGETIDIECLHSTSGKLLFQAVADHIKLQERYLFGLACESGGEYIFIEKKQKLGDFLQSCALLPPVQSIQMLFKVKFYLDDVHLMRSQSLRHLFYLQLRKDFLHKEFCPDNILALTLAALALQAEFGDYDSSTYGEDYFSSLFL